MFVEYRLDSLILAAVRPDRPSDLFESDFVSTPPENVAHDDRQVQDYGEIVAGRADEELRKAPIKEI
jgi:hypothetical protein